MSARTRQVDDVTKHIQVRGAEFYRSLTDHVRRHVEGADGTVDPDDLLAMYVASGMVFYNLLENLERIGAPVPDAETMLAMVDMVADVTRSQPG